MKLLNFIYFAIIFNLICSVVLTMINTGIFLEGYSGLISLPYSEALGQTVSDVSASFTKLLNGDLSALLTTVLLIFQLFVTLLLSVTSFFGSIIVWAGAPEALGVAINIIVLIVSLIGLFGWISGRGTRVMD